MVNSAKVVNKSVDSLAAAAAPVIEIEETKIEFAAGRRRMQIEVLSENQRSAAVPPIVVVVCLARLTFGTSLPRYQGGREESAATSNRYLSITRKKVEAAVVGVNGGGRSLHRIRRRSSGCFLGGWIDAVVKCSDGGEE